MTRIPSTLCAALTLFYALQVHAVDMQDLSKAVSEGKAAFNFRYRYEGVEQDGFEDEAQASTLLSRFSWNSDAINKFSIGIEADYISVLGSDDYNSTENGNTEFPVVADPEGFDLNQAFIKYGTNAVTVTLGRQRILHADQRFIGGVAWRQNEQTYDAVRAELQPLEGLSVDYGYVWNVNRIFGPDDGAQPGDWHGESHIVAASYALSEKHSLQVFTYMLDFENDNGPPNSTATYGIGYNGSWGLLGISATAATQSDYADSPLAYDAPYYAVATTVEIKPVTLSLGYEVLGSDDGVAAFRTPLATLHKFQGWDDIFLNTPDTGIEDAYAGIATSFGPVELALTYHNFSANEGSADYGDEFDAVVTYLIHENILIELKFADYRAKDFATDTTKMWLSLNFSL